MKNDTSVADLLSVFNIPSMFDIVAKSSGNFQNLVELLELDKLNDFRFSNLNGVDFSNVDLRGFDFQGADLRNSYGVDVLIDTTTNLEGADLQGSIFCYTKESATYL